MQGNIANTFFGMLTTDTVLSKMTVGLTANAIYLIFNLLNFRAYFFKCKRIQ